MFNFKNGQAQRPKTGQETTEGKNAFSAKEPKMTVSSLEMSEYTRKPHNDLLKSIRLQERAWEKITKGKFSRSEYSDLSGRKLPMYDFDKLEYMYVISKFDDETRAKLVMRWYELEMGKKPNRNILDHERPLYAILDRHLVRGDIKEVAEKLGVRPDSVSRVRNGRGRSWNIMQALQRQARYNRDTGRTNGYMKSLVQLELNLFEPSKTLAL